MNLPGVPPDFKFPEDPGELLAWMKNFAEKLPKYQEQLEISDADLLSVEMMWDEMREAQEAVDKSRLEWIEAQLCRVPDGWPAPPVMRELIHKIPAIEQPTRERMMEELVRWCAAIMRAGSPKAAPVLRGEYYDKGIVLQVTLPEPCVWRRYYRRNAGEDAWQFLAINGQDYYFATDAESQAANEEVYGEVVEFMAIGMLAASSPEAGFGEVWGAPSAVLRMEVRK